MHEELQGIIQRHCRKSTPIATGEKPRLDPLSNIKAVLFDVYGTLFISSSGEIGTIESEPFSEACRQAFDAVGIGAPPDASQCVERFLQIIRENHDRSHQRGIDCPEVDIVEMWRITLDSLAADRLVQFSNLDESLLHRLSVEYEVRTNPVWPMPNCAYCLESLASAGLQLGIISNAQFFTLELFPALMGATADQQGFASELQFYSYQYGYAKPGAFLFQRAAEALRNRNIQTNEALYIGNDMLNDIAAASRNGFRTALFAGDARSLRLRSGDARVNGISADLVLTDLSQLPGCLLPLQN